MHFVRPLPKRLATLALVAALAISTAEARDPKPKIPPGRDPGGVAVALVGHGLDYRRPELAKRLARDGEGEAIAWDFVDNDARPFSDDDADGAEAAVVAADGARLVTIRVAAGRPDQIAAALRFAGQTPARVILIAADPGSPIDAPHLAEAARHLAHAVLVVPERHVRGPEPGAPGSQQTGLVIVRDAIPEAGAPLLPKDRLAAAHVAALAARLIAMSPDRAPAVVASCLRERQNRAHAPDTATTPCR
ncbi:MAG: hypothetical protein AB7O57_01520 [Hyphomicrobiaceae bacterium]